MTPTTSGTADQKLDGRIQFSAYMFGFLIGGLWSFELAPDLVSGAPAQKIQAAVILAIIVVFVFFPFLIGWLGKWKNKKTQEIARILAGGVGAGLLNVVFAIAYEVEANIAMFVTILASVGFGLYLIWHLLGKPKHSSR